MTIYETTRNGVKFTIDQGLAADRQAVYHLHSERIGSQGQVIRWTETFGRYSEALSWIAHSV